MAKVTLTVVDQSVILQINQKQAIYYALHYFTEPGGVSDTAVVTGIGTILLKLDE